ncbi:MAG: hypothetical protein COA78_19765 [Blastopirellula sp.]|nr:MAG: hypothetical protein COA78_19765 [Blastopirellula sp.]
MRFTIGKKLGVGFSAMILLMVGVAVVVSYSLGQVTVTQDRLLEGRQPTVAAASGVLNGINSSLAALRGYMILGNDKSVKSRATAWQELDDHITDLDRYAKNWTNPANVAKLEELKVTLNEFRVAQQQVEDVCQAPENQPALKVLFDDAAPEATAMLSAITALIEEEKTLEATPERKELLSVMADSRGSLAVGLASIRAYLLGGDKKFSKTFDTKWTVNTERLAQLDASYELFTETQKAQFEVYKSHRETFDPMPAQMFTIRSSDQWNVANYLLGTEAAPRGGKAKALINDMLVNQKELMAADTERLSAQSSQLLWTVIIATFIGVIVGSGTAWYTTRGITQPVSRILHTISQMAKGDLTVRAQVKGNDEIADVGNAINQMNHELETVFGKVNASLVELNGSSDEMVTTATQMTSGANQSKQQARMVAAATEELATNMKNMANSTTTMSNNVVEVSKATNEMTASINEVAQAATNASESAANVAKKANATNESIGELGNAADEIGKVIGVIQDIAEQTNLLALNATIEAARAGESGKGFAVVATEVKELARQTSTATDDIRMKIENLQSSTQNAVSAISEISDSIQEVNQLSNSIASAVEEQSMTTKTISTRLDQTVSAASLVSSAIEESVQASQEISSSMTEVDRAAAETAEGASTTQQAGSSLKDLAVELDTVMSRFTISDTSKQQTHVEKEELQTV